MLEFLIGIAIGAVVVWRIPAFSDAAHAAVMAGAGPISSAKAGLRAAIGLKPRTP